MDSRKNFLSKIAGAGLLLPFLPDNELGRKKNNLTVLPNKIEVWDVYQFGAEGDGKTMDTVSIQEAIDSCHDAGGGTVLLHGGQFLSGTLILKSYVTLYIETGAELLGSADLNDYPIMKSKYQSYSGEYETNKMFIYAEDAHNISIKGRGTINGRGDDWVDGPYGFPSFSLRPRIIHFRGCENIRIKDVTLYNSGSWVQSYQFCKDLVIDGITVDSRENPDIEKPRYADAPGRNTDGMNLTDCQFVRVSNCYINSGDDAICLKSFNPNKSCKNITITNCVVSANASGIKLGTESAGAFEDITIQNCTVFDSRVDAIGLMTVDGARMERIIVSDITIRNVKESAIFIRLGSRGRIYRQGKEAKTGILKDIIIENIFATRVSYACSITGLPDAPIENLTLKNIRSIFDGGLKPDDDNGQEDEAAVDGDEKRERFLSLINREIPELEQNYPRGDMFGQLPAYGLYVRHVNNLILDDIQVQCIEEDHRPALLIDNVKDLEITRLKAGVTPHTPFLIRLINSREVEITRSRISNLPLFLEVHGNQSKDIILSANRLRKVEQAYKLEKGASKSAVLEF